MRILREYVLREHFAPFFATIAALTGMLLVGHLIKFAELVIAKGVSLFDILRLLIYLVPYMLSFTIPMACLVAMVLAFGRLSTDYELIAMRASGIAPIRLIWPILVTGFVLSMSLLIMNDRIVPNSHLAFRQQLKAIGIKQPTAYLEAGSFIREFPPYIIFIYQVERQKLFNVRIYEPQAEGPTRTIIAERGEFSQADRKHALKLTLYEGTVDEWNPMRPGAFYKVAFSTYSMNLKTDRSKRTATSRKLKELTFKGLLDERSRLRQQGVDLTPISLEFHRKIASAFAVMVFVMFGLALGLRLHHHERLISFVWVMGIFLLYYLGSVAMNAVAMKGWLPAWTTMWTPNIIGMAVSTGMMARAVRR